ncbi:hypothetical protein PIB30_105093, partial [Stylosanthes scabra]|nr:hypothetical protein [Stylosanthes scabra]
AEPTKPRLSHVLAEAQPKRGPNVRNQGQAPPIQGHVWTKFRLGPNVTHKPQAQVATLFLRQ